MKKKNKHKIEQVELSIQDWWDAARGTVVRNKKKYKRKDRRGKGFDEL